MMHLQKDVIVANKKGLHARPAALLVGIAGKYDVVVTIVKGEERVNGKSIMGLLMLGAVYQTPLTVIVDGAQAQEAMTAIEDFFSKQEEEFIK